MAVHALHPGRTNRHPVDRMGEIKEQIAQLETEFAELREKVLNGECLSLGDEWGATISRMRTRRISVKRAEKMLPTAIFNSLVMETAADRVALRRIIRRVSDDQ